MKKILIFLLVVGCIIPFRANAINTDKYCHAAPHTIVIASETKQSSQLCPHANACGNYLHCIATVTAFPRDESEYVKTSGSAV